MRKQLNRHGRRCSRIVYFLLGLSLLAACGDTPDTSAESGKNFWGDARQQEGQPIEARISTEQSGDQKQTETDKNDPDQKTATGTVIPDTKPVSTEAATAGEIPGTAGGTKNPEDEEQKDASKPSKSIDWTADYKAFLKDKKYLEDGLWYGDPNTTFASLFDVDHDKIPELIIITWDNGDDSDKTGCYYYTDTGEKIQYLGETVNPLFYETDKAYDGTLYCFDYHEDGTIDAKPVSKTDSGIVTATTAEQVKMPTTKYQGLRDIRLDAMINELPVYKQAMELSKDPLPWIDSLDDFLLFDGYVGYTNYDYRKDDLYPLLNCWDFRVYPKDPAKEIEDTPDPKGRFGGSYYRLDGKKFDWILKNIYHCSKKAIKKAKKDSGEDLASYYQDGYYYTYPYDLCGSTGGECNVVEIKQKGSLYHVKYQFNQYFYNGDHASGETYYVVLGQTGAGGKDYWTLYLHNKKSLEDQLDKITP